MLQGIPVWSHAMSSAEGQTDQCNGLVWHVFSLLSYYCNRIGGFQWQGKCTCPGESVAGELKHWCLGAVKQSWACSLNSVNFHPCSPLEVFQFTELVIKISAMVLERQGKQPVKNCKITNLLNLE